MIRISIFFLTIIFILPLTEAKGQDKIEFTCYNRDSVAWEISLFACGTDDIQSFEIYLQDSESAPFEKVFSGEDPSVKAWKNDRLKTATRIFLKYETTCSGSELIISDTLLLSTLRVAVELDSVIVTSDGQVELSWEKIPLAGINYAVKSIVDGSSREISQKISQNHYTDQRRLGNNDVVSYTISAFTTCDYTFPEPDSFFHTGFLRGTLSECDAEIEFRYKGFSHWRAGTKSRKLIVEKNGQPTDTVELNQKDTSFIYSGLENESDYRFYVCENSAADRPQTACSNIVSVHTSYYEPVRRILIKSIDFDENNNASMVWETNPHEPVSPFIVHSENGEEEIQNPAILKNNESYEIRLSDPGAYPFSVSLSDSCGHSVTSVPKLPLITNGHLSGGVDMDIEWTDIKDDEWRVDRYHIFYKTSGSFSELTSLDADKTTYQHSFDEQNLLDSLCYFIQADGELYFPEQDSTALLKIRSNTVCLYGETVLNIPNAFHPGNGKEYGPVIAPRSNITDYKMIIFDRYGNSIFETHNLDIGWTGTVQGSAAEAGVYLVLVELKNKEGESLRETGSLLLLR